MAQEPQLDTLILETLARCPSYGYRIAQDILACAPALLEKQESALYPVLYQLELDGDLESYEQRDGEKTRRYYRLTEKGQGKVAKIHEPEKESVGGLGLNWEGQQA